jgi:hypothetical protein
LHGPLEPDQINDYYKNGSTTEAIFPLTATSAPLSEEGTVNISDQPTQRPLTIQCDSL